MVFHELTYLELTAATFILHPTKPRSQGFTCRRERMPAELQVRNANASPVVARAGFRRLGWDRLGSTDDAHEVDVFKAGCDEK